MRTIASGAAALREASGRLRELYLSYGYEEVLSPSFEPWDALRPALGPRAQADSIKFIDDDGGVAVLRPEVTAGLVRRALKEIKPGEIHRYFYCQKIFRRDATGAQAGQREFWQAGGEILGGKEAFYDAEAVDLLGQSLQQLGCRDYTIELGDGGLLRELIHDEALRARCKTALNRHDGAALAALADEAPEETRPLLRELPFLRGEAAILAQAGRLAPRPLASLNRLQAVALALQARGADERILFDLALTAWADYYDGPVSEAYATGLAVPAGSGGRYDGMTRQLGRALPACGAALLLDPFLANLEPVEKPLAIVLTGEDAAASARAATLRAQGKIVVQAPALTPDLIQSLRRRYRLQNESGEPC